MAESPDTVAVYVELGKKRVFAGALDWPGWCRTGRDEGAALEALFAYGPRYACILRPARLGFHAPTDRSAFVVVERLQGNATTDFGAPDIAPAHDAFAMDDAELRRLQAILRACWRAFDATVKKTTGKTLRSGPRGGGRTLDGVVQHVLEAEQGYLSRLGGRVPPSDDSDREPWDRTRRAIQETLAAAARGEIAARGPRGGKRWMPRYFVRRVAWHVLDHLWELEDRAKPNLSR